MFGSTVELNIPVELLGDVPTLVWVLLGIAGYFGTGSLIVRYLVNHTADVFVWERDFHTGRIIGPDNKGRLLTLLLWPIIISVCVLVFLPPFKQLWRVIAWLAGMQETEGNRQWRKERDARDNKDVLQFRKKSA